MMLLVLARALVRERPGRFFELVKDSRVVGREPTPLGVGEFLSGESECREVGEGLPHSLEALGQARRQSPQRGRAPVLRAHDGKRVAEEGATVFRALGGAERAHEGLRLLALQPAPLAAAEEVLLVLALERGEGVGERRPHAPLVDAVLDPLREARGECHAPGDPGGLPLAQVCDGLQAQAVLGHQRVHDARLVHRGDRPPGRVGAEHRDLGPLRRERLLDHDGDPGVSPSLPTFAPLQPVEDLEATVARRVCADRQLGEVALGGDGSAAPTIGGQGRAELLERHEGDAGLNRHGPGLGPHA